MGGQISERPLARPSRGARARGAWRHGFGAASVLATLALALALAGMLYETIARFRASTELTAPGKMIDLGGRSVHLDCRGQGKPTVLLESGLDLLGSLAWKRVHDRLAHETRVCTYDRAGILWSDPQHHRRDAVSLSLELKAVLARAKESGPYIVVGHAMGGPYALVFAALMHHEVRGLVLLDAAHPDQTRRFARELGMTDDELPLWMRVRDRIRRGLGPFWATVGVVRLQGVPLPPDADAESTRLANAFGPPTREAIWAEESGLEATLREAGAVRQQGDRWLTVLTADPPPSASDPGNPTTREREVWLGLQQEMASWSTRGRHQVVPGARHHIQLSKPDAVIDAITTMIARLR